MSVRSPLPNWPIGVSAFFPEAQRLKKDEDVFNYSPKDFLLVNGIGSLPRDFKRKQLFEYFSTRSYSFPAIVAASALTSHSASIGDVGVQIMSGAIVQAGVKLV